jgi:hypothetical protein
MALTGEQGWLLKLLSDEARRAHPEVAEVGDEEDSGLLAVHLTHRLMAMIHAGDRAAESLLYALAEENIRHLRAARPDLDDEEAIHEIARLERGLLPADCGHREEA